MQLVRKAMETSRTEEQPCQESSAEEEEEEDADEEEDKENEMQVDNNQTDGK